MTFKKELRRYVASSSGRHCALPRDGVGRGSVVSQHLVSQRRQRFIKRRLSFWFLIVLFTAVFVAGGWSWYSGAVKRFVEQGRDRFYAVTAGMGLTLQHIYVEGQQHIGNQVILAALRVQKGGPLLKIDLAGARQRLEYLSWVKFASVERRYPDALVVHVEERVPYALWQYDGKVHVIDRQGVVIYVDDVTVFSDLLIVVGEDVPLYAVRLFDMIDNMEGIKHRISSVVRVSNRRWDMRLHNGVVIKLPEYHVAEAIAQLVRMQQQQEILDAQVRSIDLRLPDKISIQYSSGSHAS